MSLENQNVRTQDDYICETLKRFKMVDIREGYKEIIEKAIENDWGYKQFLFNILKMEDLGKRKRRAQRHILAANFEKITHLKDYDFSFHKYQNMQKIKELATLDFLNKNENILLIGKTGVGKSFIATALGLEACEVGKKVLFNNALELINLLSKATNEGKLKEALAKYSKIDLLIIDELGYLKMDKEKESIFFQLIRARYEKKSTIITTNLQIREWNEIFTSQLAATAILDRLVHHCHILHMGTGENDDSYRVKGKKKGDTNNEQKESN